MRFSKSQRNLFWWRDCYCNSQSIGCRHFLEIAIVIFLVIHTLLEIPTPPSRIKFSFPFETGLAFMTSWIPHFISFSQNAHPWKLVTNVVRKLKPQTETQNTVSTVFGNSSCHGLSQSIANTNHQKIHFFWAHFQLILASSLQAAPADVEWERNYHHWALPELQIYEQDECCHCFKSLNFGKENLKPIKKRNSSSFHTRNTNIPVTTYVYRNYCILRWRKITMSCETVIQTEVSQKETNTVY